jgi:hypothetical protein
LRNRWVREQSSPSPLVAWSSRRYRGPTPSRGAVQASMAAARPCFTPKAISGEENTAMRTGIAATGTARTGIAGIGTTGTGITGIAIAGTETRTVGIEAVGIGRTASATIRERHRAPTDNGTLKQTSAESLVGAFRSQWLGGLLKGRTTGSANCCRQLISGALAPSTR